MEDNKSKEEPVVMKTEEEEEENIPLAEVCLEAIPVATVIKTKQPNRKVSEFRPRLGTRPKKA